MLVLVVPALVITEAFSTCIFGCVYIYIIYVLVVWVAPSWFLVCPGGLQLLVPDRQKPPRGQHRHIYICSVYTYLCTWVCICKGRQGQGGRDPSKRREVRAQKGTSLPRAPARSGRDVGDDPITLGTHSSSLTPMRDGPSLGFLFGKPWPGSLLPVDPGRVERGPGFLSSLSVVRLGRSPPFPWRWIVKSWEGERERREPKLYHLGFFSVPWMAGARDGLCWCIGDEVRW